MAVTGRQPQGNRPAQNPAYRRASHFFQMVEVNGSVGQRLFYLSASHFGYQYYQRKNPDRSKKAIKQIFDAFANMENV
jgi:hypothetical protein